MARGWSGTGTIESLNKRMDELQLEGPESRGPRRELLQVEATDIERPYGPSALQGGVLVPRRWDAAILGRRWGMHNICVMAQVASRRA